MPLLKEENPSYSLYDEKLATYTTDDEFDHDAAVGFIKLWVSNKSAKYGAKKQEGESSEKTLGRKIYKIRRRMGR